VYDALRAFARGSFLRFAVVTLLRRADLLVRLLAILLIPWTLLLALPASSDHFPSKAVQWAWVGFDMGLTCALFGLLHRWCSWVAGLLGGIIALDACLTTWQAVAYNAPRASQWLDWIIIGIAVLAPPRRPAYWGGRGAIPRQCIPWLGEPRTGQYAESVSASQKNARRVDVVILTATELEYRAVLQVQAGALKASQWEEVEGPNGLPVAFCSFAAKRGRRLRVAVSRAEAMGSDMAANALLPLVERYEPRCVAMCGVCAGHPGKTNLGDVIAAERLYFHDKGKRLPKGFQQDLTTYNLRGDWKVKLERFDFTSRLRNEEWWRRRPIPIEWQENWVLHQLLMGAYDPFQLPESERHCPQRKEVIRSLRESRYLDKHEIALTRKGSKRARAFRSEYGERFPDLSPEGEELRFKVHVAPMASGSQVIEDKSIWSFLTQFIRTTRGLEMEAASIGLLAHAQRDRKLDALVMKGVMDFANLGRDDHLKEFAARASAECLLAFLREHFVKDAIPGVDDFLLTGTEGELPKQQLPSELLSARYEVVPFHEQERGPVLQELEQWCNEEPAVAVRLLHAEGGVGKTRLAIEAIRRLWIEGWNAGFLPPGQVPENWLERVLAPGQPVLVVIDYAESRPKEHLGAMLERLHRYAHAQREEGVPLRRVRLLLLARNAGDWWTLLLKSQAGLDAWLGAAPAHELKPLAMKERDREKVFREAVMRFAKYLGKETQRPRQAPLTDQRFERVLYLHMAALAAVEGLEFTASTLMKVILDHEERFWEMNAPKADARQVMATATLRGGLQDRETARSVAQKVLGRPYVEDEWLRKLHRIYQRESEGSAVFLPGLEPDLLGEAMVLRVAVPDLEEDTVSRDWIDRVLPPSEDPGVLRNGLEVLGRASAAQPEAVRPWIQQLLSGPLHTRARLVLEAAKAVGERTAFSLLGEELWRRLESHGDANVARALEEAGMPEATVSLRQVAEWTARTLLEALPVSEDEAVLKERARLLDIWGFRLSEVGRREEALKVVQEAVELYRELAHRQPEAFRPNLARSLSNLGVRWSEVGRREEALKVVQEAVELYRELTQRQPEAFQPDLARSLSNLGVRWSEVGRREEALKVVQEAVEYYRELAHKQPEAFRPDLARSLNNLGVRWSEVGKREEALKVVQEAVELYRELAHRQPEAFRLNLARSLSNLGVRWSEVGRSEEALKVVQEAVEFYRELTQRQPEAFRPDLASSLNNLGGRLRGVGRREEALEVEQEAVEFYRELTQRQPEAFQPDLAQSLSNLSVMLSEVGRREEALKAEQEAVGLRRELSQRQPEAFQPHLARSLSNLGGRWSEVGRREEALKVVQEAVELYRELAQRQPEAFQPDLAQSLSNLSVMLSEVGRREEALKAEQEAVGLRRELAQRQPEAFQLDLASSLSNLGGRWREVGRREEALKVVQEAVELYRKLAHRQPEAFQPGLAGSLSNLSVALIEVGRREEALKVGQEAAELYRKLAHRQPEAFRPGLASSLSNLSGMLGEVGRREEALKVGQEAVELYRELTHRQPEAFQPDLARSLISLGGRLSEVGRSEEARIVFEEAARMLKPFFERFPPVFEQNMHLVLRNLRHDYECRQLLPLPAWVQEIEDLFKRLIDG